MSDLGQLGVYCPPPGVWVTGYGCLDPRNSVTNAFALNQVPGRIGPDPGVDIDDPGQPLSDTARSIIEGAGHSVECYDLGGETWCAIDGGAPRYMAAVVNRSPALLLSESGAGSEAYSFAQSIRTLLDQGASSEIAGDPEFTAMSTLAGLGLTCYPGHYSAACPAPGEGGSVPTNSYDSAPAGACPGWSRYAPSVTDKLWVPQPYGGFCPYNVDRPAVIGGPDEGEFSPYIPPRPSPSAAPQYPVSASTAAGEQVPADVPVTVQNGETPSITETLAASLGLGAEGGLSAIPAWAWLAAGGAVLYFVSKGKK